MVDANSGKVRRWVGMGINPYGAVIDSRGILWAPNSCCSRGEMRSFNTNNFPVPADNSDWNNAAVSNRWEADGLGSLLRQPWSNRGNYGIAVDGKDRVYLGSYGQNGLLPSMTRPTTLGES